MLKTAKNFEVERKAGDLSATESENAEKSAIQDDAEFRDVISNEATAEEAEGIVAMREGSSFASSDFMSSLQDGLSPSAEFNAQAIGNVATKEHEPVELAPATSGPTLA